MSWHNFVKQFVAVVPSRSLSSVNEVHTRRSRLFDEFRARKLDTVSRLEKIKVLYSGYPDAANPAEHTLVMNKDLSTPYNCAQHISEHLARRSLIAMIDDEPYDMHRPLTRSCKLEFVHSKDENSQHLIKANAAYWRTGSFLLGYMLERVFKDHIKVELCAFPKPHIGAGSFVYDVDLKLPDWSASSEELRCMSLLVGKLTYSNMRFERLDINEETADKMFADNRFKREQIASIVAQLGYVPVYRLGDHVDISRGPLIAFPAQVGKFAVTAIHRIETVYGPLSRVQGVSLPAEFNSIHAWTFDLLSQRASKLNSFGFPVKSTSVNEQAPTAATS